MKTIEQNIIKFIDRNELIAENEKLLVAFSGGPDSIFALSYLVKYSSRFKITLAACHINHSLRGNESDVDEKFCKEYCSKIGIDFFSEKVDVSRHAAENSISVEEAARDKRYEILSRVADEQNCNKIVVAHNKNDNSETVLLNLIKGTGLAGISGIPYKRDNIIRPFLSTSKEDILKYLKKNKISFKIDRTNLEDDYQRNFLRNQIIPSLQKNINPSINSALLRSSTNFRDSKNLLNILVQEKVKEYLKFCNELLEIDLSLINKYGKPLFDEICRHGLKKYFSFNANFDDSLKLFDLVKNQTGRKIFLSEKLVAFKERDSLLIKQTVEGEIHDSVEIKAGDEGVLGVSNLKIEVLEKESIDYKSDRNSEIISGDNINDIFILRRWKFGDKFIPLGMNGFKNVSDFLNEQKTPSHKKEEQLVLTNNKKIVWIVGYRIDNRFKIKQDTGKAYKLCLKKL